MTVEIMFPRNPLVPGDMSVKSEKWLDFRNVTCKAPNKLEAVRDPLGSDELVIKNTNVLSSPTSTDYKHTTVGTGRSLPNGSTEFSAFRWLWLNATEFTQKGWVLVWQQQQKGSPIASINIDKATSQWFLSSRINGSQVKKMIDKIAFGQWAYFVVGTKIGKDGWTRCWYKLGDWPDVSAAPLFQRTGNTWQGETGHNTMGMYAEHGKTGQYVGYFDRYGRAATPERAIQLAG